MNFDNQNLEKFFIFIIKNIQKKFFLFIINKFYYKKIFFKNLILLIKKFQFFKIL